MVNIILILISFNIQGHAKTETQCLNNLLTKMKYSESQFTTRLMSCNNLILKGQYMYLRPLTKDTERDSLDNALRLLEFSKCEEITYRFTKYMKECTNGVQSLL